MWYFCNSRWSHSQTENKPKRRAKSVSKDRSPVPAVTESFRTGDISFSWINKASASILKCATETEGKWLCKNYQKKKKKVFSSQGHRFLNKVPEAVPGFPEQDWRSALSCRKGVSILLTLPISQTAQHRSQQHALLCFLQLSSQRLKERGQPTFQLEMFFLILCCNLSLLIFMH